MEYLILVVIALYIVTIILNLVIWGTTVYESFKNPSIGITIGDIVFMLFTLVILISPIGVFFVWYVFIDSIMKIKIK